MIKSKKMIAMLENIAKLTAENTGLNRENDLFVKDSIKQAQQLHELRLKLQESINEKNELQRRNESLTSITQADSVAINQLNDRVKQLLNELTIEKNKTWSQKLFK